MSTTTSALDNSYASALGNAISSSTGGSELDRNAFLMLLVTQFQYQDPLNPMEDKEFIAQLAQFNALEQSMQTNENLQNLLAAQEKQTSISAANYLGREVSARGYGVSVENGSVSKLEYASDQEIAKAQANIIDSTNNVVATVDLGSLAAGSIGEVNWNGMYSNGGKAPDGVYTVAIVAWNANGDRVANIDTSVTGTVTGVSYYNGEHYLRLSDGRTVLLSNVREIVDPDVSGSNRGSISVSDGEATSIRYKVPSAMTTGTATISKGSTKVATVNLGTKASGTYDFTWNAQDADGETVADGIYTVTFEGKDSKGNSIKLTVLED
ncbi:MAG: flagellar hook assembly protein FlgD [Desulfovibrionaceae bacterium]|nr:flagellar hook assembly protein FlgD [Desulfovibrionaceae bacterium]